MMLKMPDGMDMDALLLISLCPQLVRISYRQYENWRGQAIAFLLANRKSNRKIGIEANLAIGRQILQ